MKDHCHAACNDILACNTWTCENQLRAVENPLGEITTYAYTPVNRSSDEYQVIRETEEGETSYLWDNNNILQEYDTVTEAQYNYQPETYGNLLSQHREAESSYYHYDGNFSTSALTDQTQTETDRYKYTAWGETVAETGSTENPFTWKGEVGYVFDETTGLFTLRRRQYQPETGRFIGEDPIGLDSGDSNLYSYASNSPLNVIDPSGEADQWHHTLPQALREFFEDLGIDIDDKQWGWILDEEWHGKLHGQWVPDWKQWKQGLEDKGVKITVGMVKAHNTRMMNNPKYTIWLAKGRKATLHYTEWLAYLRRLRRASIALLALLGALVGGAADAAEGLAPLYELGDEELQSEIKAAIEAISKCDKRAAEIALFGDEDTCNLFGDPEGVICRLLAAQIKANEMSYNAAIRAESKIRQQWLDYARSMRCDDEGLVCD